LALGLFIGSASVWLAIVGLRELLTPLREVQGTIEAHAIIELSARRGGAYRSDIRLVDDPAVYTYLNYNQNELSILSGLRRGTEVKIEYTQDWFFSRPELLIVYLSRKPDNDVFISRRGIYSHITMAFLWSTVGIALACVLCVTGLVGTGQSVESLGARYGKRLRRWYRRGQI
jgi:hypothetical protein